MKLKFFLFIFLILFLNIVCASSSTSSTSQPGTSSEASTLVSKYKLSPLRCFAGEIQFLNIKDSEGTIGHVERGRLGQTKLILESYSGDKRQEFLPRGGNVPSCFKRLVISCCCNPKPFYLCQPSPDGKYLLEKVPFNILCCLEGRFVNLRDLATNTIIPLWFYRKLARAYKNVFVNNSNIVYYSDVNLWMTPISNLFSSSYKAFSGGLPGEKCYHIGSQEEPITACCTNNDGSRIATGSNSKFTLRKLNPDDNKLYIVHEQSFASKIVHMIFKGERLLCCTEDGGIYYWENIVSSIDTKAKPDISCFLKIATLDIAEKAPIIAIGYENAGICIYDVSSSNPNFIPIPLPIKIDKVSLSPDGKSVLVSSKAGQVTKIDIAADKLQ